MPTSQDIWNYFKQLEGATLTILDNDIVNKSKNGAEQYKTLFHCTNAHALMSIVKHREFWLNSLKWVNDKDEKIGSMCQNSKTHTMLLVLHMKIKFRMNIGMNTETAIMESYLA